MFQVLGKLYLTSFGFLFFVVVDLFIFLDSDSVLVYIGVFPFSFLDLEQNFCSILFSFLF